MKDLTDKEGLYNHGRLFAHVTVDPGCSIGDHVKLGKDEPHVPLCPPVNTPIFKKGSIL